MEAGSEQRAPPSPHYAFVVQWATDTQIAEGRMHGRVEHACPDRRPIYLTRRVTDVYGPGLREVAAHEEQVKAETARLSAPDSG